MNHETSSNGNLTNGQLAVIGLLSLFDDIIKAITFNICRPQMARNALTRMLVNNHKDR